MLYTIKQNHITFYLLNACIKANVKNETIKR